MKILFLCDYLHPKYGYQEFHLAYQLSQLKKENKISILTSDRYFPFKNYKTHKKILGKRIHNFKFKKFDRLNVFYYKPLFEFNTRLIPGFKFFWLLFKSNCEICYSHSSSSFVSIFLIIISRFLPFKLILDSHMHFVAHRKNFSTKIFYSFLKFINKHIASKKIIYLGVTKESCDFLKIKESVREEQIKLLPIGYSRKFFKVPNKKNQFIATRKKIRKELNIHSKSLLITQTGKLSKDKRPDLTIMASQFQLKQNYGHILFIGPHTKKEKKDLKELFKINKKQNWEIHFIDNVKFSNLNDFYIASDLLSYPGGASLSCIEGAASGCSSIVAFTPEGKLRNQIGIAKVPKDESDFSFIKTLHASIEEMDNTPRDINQSFENAQNLSNLVKDFSYESVSISLLEIIKSQISCQSN